MTKRPWLAFALVVSLALLPRSIPAVVLPPPGVSLESDEPQIALDRQELVLPAKKGFRPVAGRKLSLRLKVEKSKPRIGELRYSIELHNEGSETFVLIEDGGSFFKTGRLASEKIALILTNAGGTETSLRTKRDPHGIGSDEAPAGMSAAQVADWLKARRWEQKLIVRLAPGETLKTRGDASGDPYRTLKTHFPFWTITGYELKAVLNVPDKPASNSVKLRFRY